MQTVTATHIHAEVSLPSYATPHGIATRKALLKHDAQRSALLRKEKPVHGASLDQTHEAFVSDHGLWQARRQLARNNGRVAHLAYAFARFDAARRAFRTPNAKTYYAAIEAGHKPWTAAERQWVTYEIARELVGADDRNRTRATQHQVQAWIDGVLSSSPTT